MKKCIFGFFLFFLKLIFYLRVNTHGQLTGYYLVRLSELLLFYSLILKKQANPASILMHGKGA